MIGILGGSFDPVHTAHLAMADAFAAALALDEVRFLPAARPWQKDGLTASGAQRVTMLERMLAAHVAPHGRFVVDSRELDRGGSTYTVDTLTDLRRELGPDASLVFLLGADQLLHLDTWHDWTRLWDLAHLAAATRPGFDLREVPDDVARQWERRLADAGTLRSTASGHAFLLDDLALDVAATDIRRALATDGPGSSLLRRIVPPTVLDYIRDHRLYRS